MAGSKPKSTDMGAAFAGLVLGGSILFLVMLAIVWLTNSHFKGLAASGEHGPAAPAQSAPAQPAAAAPAAPATH